MAGVTLTSVSGESGWYHLVDPAQSVSGTLPHLACEPAATLPKGLYVQRGWSKKLTPERALDTVGDGAIVVRADVAKAALAGTALRTRPIVVAMTNGKKIKGWVVVVVDEWVVGDEAPRGPLARRVDAPRVLVASADFAAKLARATGNAIRAAEEVEPYVPPWVKAPYPRMTAATAKAYAAYRDAPTARGRKAAIAHPLYALATALQIDRAPKPDTRAVACRHPITATLYAILVDRAAHPATRAAAERLAWTALRYAVVFDRTISDALAKKLIASRAWDAPSVAVEREELAALDGETTATPLATRALPRRPKRVERIDAAITDAEVRADIDEMTGRGLARIGAGADDAVPDVIDKLHRYVDQIRASEVKLGTKAKAGVVRLELACAFAEQLHRAFAWQWTRIPKAVGIASGDRAYALQLLPLFARIAEHGSSENTVALLFNMIAEDNLPPSKRGALVGLS